LRIWVEIVSFFSTSSSPGSVDFWGETFLPLICHHNYKANYNTKCSEFTTPAL
jgi:hypothetical protein